MFPSKPSSPETVDLPGGTVKMRFKDRGPSRTKLNPKTCLHTMVQHGAYKLSTGTGTYK